MIYRPVRERSPQSIADSLIGGVERAGYDETGLTCLSTADFSSITPLVKSLASELRKRGVSMSVASLRAYGLNEDLLDELALTRISGLTFAPEAGTQRMRDVVNKNVTEAHIEESARRVFARGWHRLKLYFMIGLPTEEDDGRPRHRRDRPAHAADRPRATCGKRAEVTVCVSSHVPKPHTPLQWCAQDTEEEIRRKQTHPAPHRAREPGLRLKHHHSGISFIEGMLARGDRRLARRDRGGVARGRAVRRLGRGVRARALDARARGARRRHRGVPRHAAGHGAPAVGPHRRRARGRLPPRRVPQGDEGQGLSPPCGKVAGMLIHHTNLRRRGAGSRASWSATTAASRAT